MTPDLSSISLPIALRSSVPITDEELIRFSEVNKPYKIERNRSGEITIMTPVGGIGGTHEVRIASALYNWTEMTGNGVAFGPNTGFNLSDGSCLAPDAAWLSLARWNALTRAEQAGYPPLCPQFIVEVRSQSDSRRSLEAKMQLWLENGAELAWLIDPIDGNVSIYHPGENNQTLDRPESVSGSGPVEGFMLLTARLWFPKGMSAASLR